MTSQTQQCSTRRAARDAGITADHLWLHYYSVGGDVDVFGLNAYLQGVYDLPREDRNIIAMALNEMIDNLPRRLRAELEP